MLRRAGERLVLWIGAFAGAIALVWIAGTAPPTTPAWQLGIFLIVGVALGVIAALGFAGDVVAVVNAHLPLIPVPPGSGKRARNNRRASGK
jgi:hypothetical protein